VSIEHHLIVSQVLLQQPQPTNINKFFSSLCPLLITGGSRGPGRGDGERGGGDWLLDYFYYLSGYATCSLLSLVRMSLWLDAGKK